MWRVKEFYEPEDFKNETSKAGNIENKEQNEAHNTESLSPSGSLPTVGKSDVDNIGVCACGGRGLLYRLGGNSCLSGDWMSAWRFDHELQIGETIIFEDMLHYTTVKTCTFNGISHPAICLLRENNELVPLREYSYEDYRDRMD